MARSVVLLALLSAVFRSVSASGYSPRNYCDKFSSASNCRCIANRVIGDSISTYQLKCSGGAKINMDASFYDFYLECTSTTNMRRLMDDLSDLSIGLVTDFKLTGCPLSNVSIQDIMSIAGITDVVYLTVDSNINATFQKKNFVNLDNITNLILINNNLTELPVDLFEGMSGLICLEMKHNVIDLPEGVFSTIPKLEYIFLINNSFAQLKLELFYTFNKLTHLILTHNQLEHNITNGALLDLPNLHTLDLSYNNITTMIPGFFDKSKKVKEVYLNGNAFISLPQRFLSTNLYIEKFTMTENINEIVTLPQEFLSNLPELKSVDLTGSKIIALPEDLFWNSTSIENIELNRNFLTNLSENIFRDLTQLWSLELRENYISHLPEGLFKNTTALKYLDLSENLISHLPECLFNNTPALEYLDLSKNHISHLPKGLFNRTFDLTILKLNNNRIKIVPKGLFQHVSGLSYLYLGFNQIEEIDGDILSGSLDLSVLDISNNKLSKLAEDMEDMKLIIDSLEELRLANNSLTEVHTDWLRMRQVDLSFNHIQTSQITNEDPSQYFDIHIDLANNNINRINVKQIVGHDVVSNGKLKHFYLKNNPLTCDCHLLPFLQLSRGQFPYSSFISIHGTSELKCSEPERLSGMSLDNVTDSSLTCDLSDLKNYTCPTNCSCEYRPSDQGNIITCQDAGLTQLPEQLTVYGIANHTELNIEGNHLQHLQIPFNNGYENVTHWKLSNNDIADIGFARELAAKLELLDLSYNKLSELSAETIEFIKRAEKVKTIALHGNPWKCDCKTESMKRMLREKYTQITDIRNVTCLSDEKPMVNLERSELCVSSLYYFAIVCLICALSGMLIATLTVLYSKYQQQIRIYCFSSRWRVLRWMVSRPGADKEKKYDAFICYADPDESFVINLIVPYLEENGETKFKLCLHKRDWMPGESISFQVLKSIKESRKTIVVLSPSYLMSDWGRMEFTSAYDEALQDGKARLIVILYQDVGPIDKLDKRYRIHLQMNNYLNWESPWFWQQLSLAMTRPFGDDDDGDIRCVFCRRSNRNQSNDCLGTSECV